MYSKNLIQYPEGEVNKEKLVKNTLEMAERKVKQEVYGHFYDILDKYFPSAS